ncbi:MAG: transketolase [Candidatus Paceibacterota bacterium]|jgi:transketolase
MFLSDEKLEYLTNKACVIRRSIIEMLVVSGSGHTGGSLGLVEIFTALYFGLLNYKPEQPNWSERDRLIVSNGHVCPVLYATMAQAGYFPLEELKTLRRLGSRLQGHPERLKLPGLETSSGPLGEGLGQTLGMILADRLDRGHNSQRFFYCLLSDGELQEGSTWEAIMAAGKEAPHNLIAFVDRNHIQSDGMTDKIMPLEPLVDKWRAFGWQVQEIDGHSFQEIFEAVGQAKSVFGRPSVIIAHTISGKGVPEWERKYNWHGKTPNVQEAKGAIENLI